MTGAESEGEIIDITTLPEVLIINYDPRPLYERNLQEVLSAAKGYYRGNDPDYFNGEGIREDLNSVDEKVKENITVIKGMTMLVQTLSDDNWMNYSDTMSVICSHGFSLYFERIGYDIAVSFRARKNAIKKRSLTIEALGACDINIDEATGIHTTIHIPKTLSGRVGKHARMACIPKLKLYALLACYSVLTHPECTGYHEICKQNVMKFECLMQERIKLFR